MNETIYLKKLEQREIKPTAIRLLILNAAQRSIFTVGFGKRIGYGRQINHLPHHNPFFSPSFGSWH